jgi:hypothetical protein
VHAQKKCMASGSERYQCTVKTTHYANVTRLTKRWCFSLTWHVWPLGHFLLLLRPLCWDELWGAGCVKWLVFSLVGLDDWGLPGSGHIRGLCPGFIPIWRGSGPCCDCGAAHSCFWPARACNDSGTVYVVTWQNSTNAWMDCCLTGGLAFLQAASLTHLQPVVCQHVPEAPCIRAVLLYTGLGV